MLILGAVGFQNCGKAGFDSGDTSGLSLSSTTADAFPYAFDVVFDQITYNSCYGSAVQGRPWFYTLMAGAYGAGAGVKIRPEFFTYMRSSGNIKPDPDAGYVTTTQMKMALASSNNNIESVPQMAIRTRGSPQQVRTPSAVTAAVGVDYIPMLGDLTDDRWMDPLVKNESGYTQYFNLAPSRMRNLEAKITYNKDEGTAQGVRDDLALYSQLALTIKPRSDVAPDSGARMVGSTITSNTSGGQVTTVDPSAVFGRGYVMQFEPAIAPYTYLYREAEFNNHYTDPVHYPTSMLPWNSIYTIPAQNVLTQVTEMSLENNGAAQVSWSCPQNLRYTIVRTVDHPYKPDANPANWVEFCPRDRPEYLTSGIPRRFFADGTLAKEAVSAAAYRAELEVVRRSLPAEYWDVSVEFKCAVPKISSGECYPPETGAAANFGIEYDQAKPCYQALPGLPYTNPIPQKRCAQYVSICQRP